MDPHDLQGIQPCPDRPPYPRGVLPGADNLRNPEGVRALPDVAPKHWEVRAADPYNPHLREEPMSPAMARGCFLAVMALVLALPLTLYAFVLIAWSSR